MSFSQEQLARLRPLWNTMVDHRFLRNTRDGIMPEERGRMADYFALTTKYEIAFWEMAATAEGWPGVPS